MLVHVLYGLSGVCFYAAIYHALIAWRRPVDRTHLWFALLCATIAVYVIAKAGAYQADTAGMLVRQRRWELSLAMVAFVLLPWFVWEYTGRQSRWSPLALSLCMGVVLMANLLLPFGVAFTQFPELARVSLPWGEQVADLRAYQGGMWYQIAWAGMLLVFIYCLYASWRQYRRGEKRQALTMTIAISVFMVFVLFNRLVNEGIINFIHTAEFGFLALLFVMHQGLAHTRKLESERDTLRQQVLHADRVVRISALGTSLAHELSQPLTAILSNAQAGLRFMEQGVLAEEELRGIFTDIVHDDERAIAIIAGLRAMVRQKSTARERIDLAEAVTEAIDLLHDEILRRGVHCERDLQTDCQVLADKVQIGQVVINLVMNALDALGARPDGQRQLRISVVSDGNGEARMVVRDFGVGLPLDAVDRIFDSFYSTKSQGLGIGLALCRSIIETHGGRIWASNNTDQGATVQFVLPMVREGQV
jgi:signal transduction histidine kinase